MTSGSILALHDNIIASGWCDGTIRIVSWDLRQIREYIHAEPPIVKATNPLSTGS
jgi:hypothetical protein